MSCEMSSKTKAALATGSHAPKSTTSAPTTKKCDPTMSPNIALATQRVLQHQTSIRFMFLSFCVFFLLLLFLSVTFGFPLARSFSKAGFPVHATGAGVI